MAKYLLFLQISIPRCRSKKNFKLYIVISHAICMYKRWNIYIHYNYNTINCYITCNSIPQLIFLSESLTHNISCANICFSFRHFRCRIICQTDRFILTSLLQIRTLYLCFLCVRSILSLRIPYLRSNYTFMRQTKARKMGFPFLRKTFICNYISF